MDGLHPPESAARKSEGQVGMRRRMIVLAETGYDEKTKVRKGGRSETSSYCYDFHPIDSHVGRIEFDCSCHGNDRDLRAIYLAKAPRGRCSGVDVGWVKSEVVWVVTTPPQQLTNYDLRAVTASTSQHPTSRCASELQAESEAVATSALHSALILTLSDRLRMSFLPMPKTLGNAGRPELGAVDVDGNVRGRELGSDWPGTRSLSSVKGGSSLVIVQIRHRGEISGSLQESNRTVAFIASRRTPSVFDGNPAELCHEYRIQRYSIRSTMPLRKWFALPMIVVHRACFPSAARRLGEATKLASLEEVWGQWWEQVEENVEHLAQVFADGHDADFLKFLLRVAMQLDHFRYNLGKYRTGRWRKGGEFKGYVHSRRSSVLLCANFAKRGGRNEETYIGI
ncbi:hypothetical protein EYR40_009187 [Pleurotus pulmonarius]|nr:hypothetical protein EYR40_009187 [Pleurotus pulmonarius]